jgi:hypothetical protein
VAVVAVQQEFCSTIPYYLLQEVEVAAVVAPDLILGNQRLAQAVRPLPVYMQAKTAKITLVTEVAAVEAEVDGPEAMAAQSA